MEIINQIKSINIWISAIAVIVIVIIGMSGFLAKQHLLQQKENIYLELFQEWGINVFQETPKINNSQIEAGIPFAKDDKISVYQISNKQFIKSNLISNFHRSKIYKDKLIILNSMSPDFKSFAFVDETFSLKVVAADLSYEFKLLDMSNSKFTLGLSINQKILWSKDANKILFELRSIKSDAIQQPFISEEEQVAIKKLAGTYIIDLRRKVIQKIDMANNTKALFWIDNQHLMVEKNDKKSFYGILEIKDLSIDYLDTKSMGYGQFSNNNSGNLWVFSKYPFTYTTDEIIYAKFPSFEGEIIKKGAWTEFQWPTISPDGSNVIFVKKVGVSNIDSIYSIWIYNNKEDFSKELTKGRHIEAWVDNEKFIFSKRQYLSEGSFLDKYYLYNIHNNSITPIIY